MQLGRIFLALILCLPISLVRAEEEQKGPPAQTLFTNVLVWNGTSNGLSKPTAVLVENNLIKKVGAGKGDAHAEAVVIDGKGSVLMPGLIDTHTHIAVPEQLGTLTNDVDFMYWGVSAAQVTEDWLMRGYTTVRDAGGPAVGLQKAVADGKVAGPRIYPSGAVISQTSGHGDHRAYNTPHPNFPGNTPHAMQTPSGFELLCDGVSEVLRCSREVLRSGATQLKVMSGGGASSSFGPLYTVQYLPEELEAEISGFVDYYNNQRYHESLQNLTHTDVYFGRDKQIKDERERIKKKTLQIRRRENLKWYKNEMAL